MFTLRAIFNETKEEEFCELDEAFKIVGKDNQMLGDGAKQFPNASKFIISGQRAIPLLDNGVYEIINTNGIVVKTVYNTVI